MGKIISKPWGYEEIWAESESYLGKLIVINPGHRLSLQYHNHKEETIRVLSGTLSLWDDTIIENGERRKIILLTGSTYHVKPGQIHRFGNDESNDNPVVLIEVSTNWPEDVVRLEDDYNRDE